MNKEVCHQNMVAAFERENAISHERATRLANAPPEDHLAIRREYYVSKVPPVSISDLVPWSAEGLNANSSSGGTQGASLPPVLILPISLASRRMK